MILKRNHVQLTRKVIELKVETFKKFLAERGAEVLTTTNEWEVIRFRCSKGVSIIYANKRSELTFYGRSGDAWDAFTGSKTWRAFPATRRSTNNVVNTIRQRDGDNCFYCLKSVSIEDESEEHLLSLTHQGPDTLHNKVLAHKACNQKAGSLPLAGKIALHVLAHKAKVTK